MVITMIHLEMLRVLSFLTVPSSTKNVIISYLLISLFYNTQNINIYYIYISYIY